MTQPWRDALDDALIWAPWSRPYPGAPAEILPGTGGRLVDPKNAATWCRRDTALESAARSDAGCYGAGIVIGAPIPAAAIATTGDAPPTDGDDGAVMRSARTASRYFLGRLMIDNGYRTATLGDGTAAPVYSDLTVQIAEVLRTVTERHCHSPDVSLLFGYAAEDEVQFRSLAMPKGTLLVAGGELFVAETEPALPAGLDELQLLTPATIIQALEAATKPPAGGSREHTEAIGHSTPHDPDDRGDIPHDDGDHDGRPFNDAIPAMLGAPQTGPPLTALPDALEPADRPIVRLPPNGQFDYAAIADAIYTANQGQGVHREFRSLSDDVRLWLTRQAFAATNAVMAQLDPLEMETPRRGAHGPSPRPKRRSRGVAPS